MANTRNLKSAGRTVALLAAALLVLQPVASLHAQDVAPAAAPRGLQIVILEGEGALNNTQERTAREPIVQVQDENHKPVAGAFVLFAIHGGGAGAGGTFADGATTLTVTTGADGTAKAVGLLANKSQGAWQISVAASVGTLTASAVINENNVVAAPQNTVGPTTAATVKPPFHWIISKPVTIVGGIIIAGAIATIVVVETNNSNGTKITAGNPTVGAPALRTGIQIRF
ncbi:MAG TPA: hypothetical protein VHX60_14470 [Acidobacteriaceae bacterium]|nr:hypothetical protein [Acidobacteriaceae bacterium]